MQSAILMRSSLVRRVAPLHTSSTLARTFLTSTHQLQATPAASSAAPASATAAPAAAPRSLLHAARAAGFPNRLLRLADDVATHRQPTFSDGKWHKAALSARDVARFRKADLYAGGTWAEHEKVRLRRITPTVLKGHKREKVVLDRKARIVAAMQDMDERVEEHWKSERARRVRPTFFQQITGKKPSGVIAAEEAALKEKKEKNKEREKARQAAQTTIKK